MIFAVVRTHLARLRRDRAAFVLAFVVPIVFFSIFAGLFGSSRGGGARRISVAVVDEDGSENSRRLVAALKTEKGLSIMSGAISKGSRSQTPFDRASAEAAVREGDVPLALIIPKDFGRTPIRFGASARRPKLELLADSSDPVAPQVVSGLLQGIAATAMPEAMARTGMEEIDRWGGGLTAEQRAKMEENLRVLRDRTASGTPAGGAAAAGLVDVQVRDILGETKKNPTSALLAAGLGVMFLLFSAAGAGGALIEEAESGTLDRILSTRVSMGRLLLGKVAYLSAVAVTQLVVMFVWGELFFGLELHRHIPGFLIMTVATAVACSCFGLVLAALSRSRIQLVALSNLLILAMSALGGSMVPRYLLSETIQKFGLVTLNAWAIDGFMKVFWRDEPIVNLWPQVAALLAGSLLLFAAARRLARRWDVA
jgi:linearmycin/streptolysin S transport system permease protein